MIKQMQFKLTEGEAARMGRNMKTNCYYNEFDSCACDNAPCYGNKCAGAECEYRIDEKDYFRMMMEGTLPQAKQISDDSPERKAEIRKKLSPGKTKKQLKYDRKKEEEKMNPGTGYSLKDDPRFKDLFG